jgi:hypothetical protein
VQALFVPFQPSEWGRKGQLWCLSRFSEGVVDSARKGASQSAQALDLQLRQRLESFEVDEPRKRAGDAMPVCVNAVATNREHLQGCVLVRGDARGDDARLRAAVPPFNGAAP